MHCKKQILNYACYYESQELKLQECDNAHPSCHSPTWRRVVMSYELHGCQATSDVSRPLYMHYKNCYVRLAFRPGTRNMESRLHFVYSNYYIRNTIDWSIFSSIDYNRKNLHNPTVRSVSAGRARKHTISTWDGLTHETTGSGITYRHETISLQRTPLRVTYSRRMRSETV